MAFSSEQVAAVLSDADNYRKKMSREVVPHLHRNYDMILHYLTGETTGLQGLEQDASNYHYRTLTDLLGTLDPPSSNDQLVLDIMLDPVIFPAVHTWLFEYLALNCIRTNTPSVIQFTLGLYQTKRSGPEDLFNNIMRNLQDVSREEWDNLPAQSPVKQFLSANIPATPGQIMHAQSIPGLRHYDSSHFKHGVFFLLEDYRPDWIPRFIKESFLDDGAPVAAFLERYKNGAYKSVPEQWMKERSASPKALAKQISAAVRLFYTDKTKNKETILQMVTSYLTLWKEGKATWETNYQVHIPELEHLHLGYYMPTRTVCWLMMLEYDPDLARSFAAAWYTAGIPLIEKEITLFHHYLGHAALPVLLSAASLDADSADNRKYVIDVLHQHFTVAEYSPVFWELVGNKSKPIRETVVHILVRKDPQAEAKAIPLLQHKKSDIRQSASLILNILGTPSAKAAMIEALNNETNDNARDILLETVADSLPEQGDKTYVDSLVTAAGSRGKLSKPSSVIPDEEVLPELFYTTGERLDIPAIRFLLYRMSRCKGINSDIEARYLLRLIDKTRSTPFAAALLQIFLDRQAAPEEKYLMLLSALLGNEDMAVNIRHLIDTWINNGRLKMAEYGVGALALQGSDKALRWVEWYSRKYTAKKASVGTAATAALEAAATELGITTYELGDRVVPDLGFDGLFRHFEAGGESYRAFIDSKFKLAFFNESDKKLKAIPSSASEELKEEFKAITKEVRDIAKSQSPRLEYYLIIQRRWNLAQWQKFFLNNPVMFIFATRLLWGVYKDLADTPDITFLCDEDTTLLDPEEEELTPQPEWNIGIVHPSQLDPSTLRAWQKKFFDKAIEAVFPQLDRGQADLEGLDLSKTIIRKFDGRRTQTGSIRSTLDRRGWRAGPTGDGGMIGTYHLLHDAKKLEAILEIEGVGAGFGWTGDEKAGRLYFVRREDPRKKWWHYPKDESDPLLVPPKEIPTLFLHETLTAIDAIKPAPAT